MKNLVPQKPVKLSLCSSPAYLPIMRAAVEKMCLMIGFDPDTTGKVVLSADEAMTNVIRHAYDDEEDKPIEIELTPLGNPKAEAIKICLRDWGKQVDPSQIKSRDIRDVRPGGLGVHIMTECMDQVDFQPCNEGGTLLTMIKRR